MTTALIVDKLDLTIEYFKRVKKIIYGHCGIDLCDGKRALVNSRLVKRTRKINFTTITAYIDHVSSNKGKDEFINFVNSLSTNFTSFYRENDHFSYLTRTLLTKLIQKKQHYEIINFAYGQQVVLQEKNHIPYRLY